MPSERVFLINVPKYRISAAERLAEVFDGVASFVDEGLTGGVDMMIEASPDILQSVLDAAVEVDFEARLA